MFWSRPTVSEDMRGWIYECFDWFDGTFGPASSLILPTKAFFTAGGGIGQETANAVLEDVKRSMRFDETVEIVPLDVLSADYRHTYQSTSEVAGTFQNAGGVPLIQYDPEQMHRPIGFINVLAHELMHAKLSGLEDSIPGGAMAHELATDLGCIIAGFGIFQLQAADDAGWSGYMSQQSRAFALAVFLENRGLGIDDVKPFLSTRCTKLVTRAIKEI